MSGNDSLFRDTNIAAKNRKSRRSEVFGLLIKKCLAVLNCKKQVTPYRLVAHLRCCASQAHFLFRPADLNVFQKRHVFQKPIDLESTPGVKVSEGNNLMRIERRKIHYETGIDNGFSVDAVASVPYNDRRIKRGGTWPYDDRRGKQTVRTFGGYASLL